MDLELPDFLNRKKWTPEQVERSNWLWDDLLEESRARAIAAHKAEIRKRDIRRLERELGQLYAQSGNYVEGTNSAKMNTISIDSRRRKLAVLKTEEQDYAASQNVG